ncbi:MAG: hypothetical protein BGO49_16475 [Planctomycetales bacterium 71-10]|nr:MAG: hypothetical protein BGO49_16475 [Planctomycetales bacterium 71-10]
MIHSKSLWRRLIPPKGEKSGASARRNKQWQPTVDGLEGRLVLSRMGGLGGGMAARAAMFARAGSFGSTSESSGDVSSTAQVGGFEGRRGGPGGFGGPGGRWGGGVRDTQLAADLKSYQTAATAVLKGSSVTDADREALRDAFDALREAGVTYDKDALATVADGVLSALADSDDSTTAESYRDAFLAAFAGATGDDDTDSTLTDDETALVNAAFDAFVTVADKLDVDSDELSALATAREAIAADYTRLGITGVAPSDLDLILGGLGGGPGGPGPRGFC